MIKISTASSLSCSQCFSLLRHVACFLILNLCLGCNVSNPTKNQAISKVIYEFKDASIPPTYHRSFKATLTDTQAHLIVDSYGDLITDTTTSISTERFNQVLQHLPPLTELPKHSQPIEPVSVGGTQHILSVYSGSNLIYSSPLLHHPNAQENLLNAIKACFHHFDDLLKLEGSI